MLNIKYNYFENDNFILNNGIEIEILKTKEFILMADINNKKVVIIGNNLIFRS